MLTLDAPPAEPPADTDLAKDLCLLEALREGKKDFYDTIIERSATDDYDVVTILRQEPTYQLAEFLFALSAYGIASAEAIKSLTELHNRYLTDLTGDREKQRRIGLNEDRIKRALFTEERLSKLLENWRREPPAIDQSDLARLLVGVMSTETCRRVVVACERAGFVEREQSPYSAILIYSNGLLEEIFGRCLRQTRRAISDSEIT